MTREMDDFGRRERIKGGVGNDGACAHVYLVS